MIWGADITIWKLSHPWLTNIISTTTGNFCRNQLASWILNYYNKITMVVVSAVTLFRHCFQVRVINRRGVRSHGRSTFFIRGWFKKCTKYWLVFVRQIRKGVAILTIPKKFTRIQYFNITCCVRALQHPCKLFPLWSYHSKTYGSPECCISHAFCFWLYMYKHI